MPKLSQVKSSLGQFAMSDTVVISHGTTSSLGAASVVHNATLSAFKNAVGGGGSNFMTYPNYPNEWTMPQQAYVAFQMPTLGTFPQDIPFLNGHNVRSLTVLGVTSAPTDISGSRYQAVRFRAKFTNKFAAVNDPGGTFAYPYAVFGQTVGKPNSASVGGTVPYEVRFTQIGSNLGRTNYYADFEVSHPLWGNSSQNQFAAHIDTVSAWFTGPTYVHP